MGKFNWLFGTREVPGQAQVSFDHPKIYGEVESGPGVAAASQAATNWRDRVSTAFGEADKDLDRVLKKFEVVIEGAAGDQARDAVTPLSQATRESIEVAAQTGAVVEQQAQGSADFKNAFPAPYQVPPDNIGLTDYVNPVSYSVKSGVRAAHEENHDQVEAQAREQYESYTLASNDRANSIFQFPPPPMFTGDVEPADTTPVNKVDPNTGYTITTDSGTSTARTSPGAFDIAGPAGQSSAPPVSQAPAESGSAWAAPPAASTTPGPIAGTPTSVPGIGGGFVGGTVIPPGNTATPGAGGQAAGSGRGGVGSGSGVGRGVGGRVLGPGGSSGVGGSTPGSPAASGSASPRGGAGGIVAGAGPAGRGQRDEEDKEHTNKYAEPTKEAWLDLELPKTAPPVFGDWAAQSQEGKPPRPPEED
ncbi:hypothetical protein [Saccharopolyspora shandongensis]|uniref:hypothetical protein n=1 Tax=Saccharopolyspora shandongensis TaxID=418495 RepID=UPI00340E0598